MNKTELTDDLISRTIEIRRYLHQYPELSGQEYKTSKFIQEKLLTFNIELLDFDEPSVVGFLKGSKGEKTIALRADIDALPIMEEGDKPYISKVPGVAHACGHDGHVAVLLAVAEWLSQNREKIEHNVVFIFQSSEEMTPSGAKALIDQGVLSNVDSIFGMHLWQGEEKGKIGLTYGSMMASADEFEIIIKGKGGHGAAPHETIDPIYISTYLIQALQSIISRTLNPIHPGVISIGKIESGTTFNIIPDSAKIYGTVRALTPETVKIMREQIVQLTAGICASFGASGEVNYFLGTPPLVNDLNNSKFVEKVIQESFGKEVIKLIEPVMAGEDFSHYLLEKPGSFIFVGMGSEKSNYPHHHPRFDLDEEVFPIAIQLLIDIVKNYR